MKLLSQQGVQSWATATGRDGKVSSSYQKTTTKKKNSPVSWTWLPGQVEAPREFLVSRVFDCANSESQIARTAVKVLWCGIVNADGNRAFENLPALFMRRSNLDSVFRKVWLKQRTDFRLARSNCIYSTSLFPVSCFPTRENDQVLKCSWKASIRHRWHPRFPWAIELLDLTLVLSS